MKDELFGLVFVLIIIAGCAMAYAGMTGEWPFQQWAEHHLHQTEPKKSGCP
jgi:hypothetical protein